MNRVDQVIYMVAAQGSDAARAEIERPAAELVPTAKTLP